MNKCFLIGNLTQDPELKTTSGSGLSVCSFTLAVTRRFANQSGEREADFIPVVAWRATAETCAKYLSKGSRAAVAGAIQTRSYTGNDGRKRYVTEVVADEVQFLSAPQESGERRRPAPAATPGARQVEPFDRDDGDNLPF